jgi:hypothetical protein
MTTTTRAKNTTLRAWGAGRAGTRFLLVKTNGALDKARRSVTQKDAFEAFNDVVEDLAQFAAQQQGQIVALQDVVCQLAEKVDELAR